MDSTKDHFSELPDELKAIIFGKLTIVDIRKARRVCKDWMHILNDFVRMRVKLTDDTVSYVENCSALTIDCLSIKNFQKNVNLLTSTDTALPEAKTIIIDTGNSNENLMNIWRHSFKVAKILHVRNSSLAPVNVTSMAAVIPFVNWPTLVELRVMIVFEVAGPRGLWSADTSRCHLLALTEFFKGLNVPCLKDVRIVAVAGNFDTQKYPLSDFYAQFSAFLVRHKSTLLSLNIFVRGSYRGCAIKGIELPELTSVNLETLCLDFDAYHAQMCMNITLAGNNLKTLVLDKEYWMTTWNLDIPLSFKDVIQKNRKTLESVTIKKSSLDCEWFDGCEALKSLELIVWNPINLKYCGVLPALKKLDIDGYVVKNWTTECAEKPEILRDEILDWIQNSMINLEILRLEFNFGLKFTVQHYDSLMRRLPKLRMLQLTRIKAKEFEKLERENPSDSPIRVTVILVVPQATQIPYHVFQMTRTANWQL